MDEIFGRKPEVIPLALASTYLSWSERQGNRRGAEGGVQPRKQEKVQTLGGTRIALQKNGLKRKESQGPVKIFFFKIFLELKKAEKAEAEEEPWCFRLRNLEFN
ncbi:uncharacterized protein ISCGN_001104 [Ixodes scapularis]